MSSIITAYSSVFEKLKSLNDRYQNAESQLKKDNVQDELLRKKRIDNLTVQLEKIEEYSEKLEAFRLLAEKHLESKNLLTITPRELNFNRLRNWSMMIDPTESDDPYAQRIYVQVKCNEMFLAQKKAEFETTLEELTSSGTSNDEELKQTVAKLRDQLITEARGVLESDEFAELSTLLAQQHDEYLQTEHTQNDGSDTSDKMVGFGAVAKALPIFEELRYVAKAKLGDYYDMKHSSVLLPVEHAMKDEVFFSIGCTASKSKKLYRGIQNYILNIINRSPVGERKVYFLDALHYNSSALGFLRPLEGTIAIEPVPRDLEQITDTLKQIVSSFSDIDEALGLADSVAEYNASAEAKDRIPRTVLVLVGYPSSFPGESNDLIKRILLNYEHYGITPILVDTQFTPKKEDEMPAIPVDVVDNIAQIRMTQHKELIQQNRGTDFHFRWYELKQELSETFVSTIRSYETAANTLGTEYINRVDMENFPPYERGKKSIVLPYGVDSKDEVHSISFDNENFASFLMGASGSGKSTLLHTLITGIIRNYHPDDVELWLADFKMSEFAQYIDPLPPHVKYILLDESPELVYDLIDKLTEKMMERQRFFMKHRDMKKVENVPSNIYMPVIFVILDEFSIMSQAVADSEAYKLKLQNLLAKGRALGIKFIFASQTFTKGIAGLTQTAKDQIQTRIAMKNSYSEINETLELSAGIKTDQVRNWMEALPPHYTLTKYRDGDRLQVRRLKVMYFKGKGDEALLPQRRLINHLNSTMTAVPLSTYDEKQLNAFVEKEPVIVDGNSYNAFHTETMLQEYTKQRLNNPSEYAPEDVLVSFGSPRRMTNAKYTALTRESRENILLVARSTETACGMSIISTVSKSFAMQGAKVQIWAYAKNRLYKTYKDGQFSSYEVCEGIDEICKAISELREKIARKEYGNELIVMVGMEQICIDFEFMQDTKQPEHSSAIDATRQSFVESGAVISSDDEEQRRQYALKWMRYKKPFVKEAEAQGKTKEEINELLLKLELDFRKEQGYEAPEQNIAVQEPKTKSVAPAPVAEQGSAYNAQQDLQFIVMQGSRLGYHFLLALSSYSDLKQTGLKLEYFRYKLSFQASVDDSRTLFGNKVACGLPEHICQFDDSFDRYSFRPLLHNGINWDGWSIDADGKVISPFSADDN